MEENLKQEALLRHLLSRENCEDDDFVYSFILGSRLFLSPHQLLTELHRLANEENISQLQGNSSEKCCSKCRQMLSKNLKGTDFRSKRLVSSEVIVTEGEDTIRRRRRGRRRNQLDSESDFDSLFPVVDNPRLSRDSGILSAVLEPLEIDNNNVGKTRSARARIPSQCNDSGYLADDDVKSNCNDCLRQLQKDTCLRSKHQLLLILREWVRHFPSDFRNIRTKWTLHDVIKSCKINNEDSFALCTEVIDCISRRTAAQESYEQQLNELDNKEFLERELIFTKPKKLLQSYALKFKDEEDVNQVAQQLCLIEMELLKHVGAEEFLQLFTEDGEEDARTNLGACVRWFNRLGRLVATLICLCRKRKHARQVITFYTRVANKCFELSNFNSSMAILTGLSFGPVTRLKKTWRKLVLPELKKLQAVFDPSNNFLKYRSAYTSRAEQLHTPISTNDEKTGDGTNRYSIISQHSLGSAASSHHVDSGIECENELPSPGCQSPLPKFQASMKHFNFDPKQLPDDGVMVPFLVLLVKDVYFLNHAIQTVDEVGNINFEKLRNLSNILRPLEEWKKMSSPYQKQDKIQEFLLNAPIVNDADLYLSSYKRESPTNRFEKLQLKNLKSRILKNKRETFDSRLKSKTV